LHCFQDLKCCPHYINTFRLARYINGCVSAFAMLKTSSDLAVIVGALTFSDREADGIGS
jgi:hypothetical protein